MPTADDSPNIDNVENVPEHGEAVSAEMNRSVEAECGRRWVKINPAEAVKVLLETGALEQCAWRENAEDTPYGYAGPRYLPLDDEDDSDDTPSWWRPVYRLVTEENRDG